MLLLLRSATGGAPSANVGLSLGLTGVAGPLASLGISLGLGPPSSIELNVFALPDIHFGITAISAGFVTRTANLTTSIDLTAAGGFGDIPALDIRLGLAGTVGSFLQGIANTGIVCGLAGTLIAQITANADVHLQISGAPDISGGLITPTANVDLVTTLNGAALATTHAVLDMTCGLSGFGFPNVVGLATEMRLSFSADSIRLFFRKG